MLRTLRDRIWLTDRQPEPQPIHPTMSPTAMHERRAELQALMSTAPADHRELIERLTTGHAGSTEVHEHLVAAVNAQQERRDWIVANWPHVVELEQLNALIAAQPALAHWPTAVPPPVQAVLDTLASTATPPPSREQRTLATLDQEAAANDPVRQAQAKIHDLDRLATRVRDERRAGRGRRRHCGRHGSSSDRLAESNTSTTSSPDTAAAPTTTPSNDAGSPSATTSSPTRPTGSSNTSDDCTTTVASALPASTIWLPGSSAQPCTSTATDTSPTAGRTPSFAQLPVRSPSSRSACPSCDPGSESGGHP